MSHCLPTNTRLYLVRHGQVETAWQGRLYGCHDVDLSPQGRSEAQAAADQLKDISLAAVISSGLRRTEFGARCLRASRDCERRDDFALRELERGTWVGLRPEETPDRGWEKWSAAPDLVRAPGGENLEDLAARVLPRIEAHVEEYASQAIAIVAHSWVLRVATCYALGLSLANASRLNVPTGSISVIDWPNDSTPAGEPVESSRWGARRGGRQPTLASLGPSGFPLSAATWSTEARSRESRPSDSGPQAR